MKYKTKRAIMNIYSQSDLFFELNKQFMELPFKKCVFLCSMLILFLLKIEQDLNFI